MPTTRHTCARPGGRAQARTAWGASLVAAATVSCASTAPDSAAPLVVPLRGDRYLLFVPNAVEEWRDTRRNVAWARPGAGSPVVSCVDWSGGWACVAYENDLAAVSLIDASVRWTPERPPWQRPPSAVATSGDWLASLHGREVRVWRLPDLLPAWSADAGPWLEREGLDDVRAVVPRGRDEFVLVGTRASSLTAGPRTVVQRVDRRSGTWERVESEELEEIHWPQAVATEGEGLYVAGFGVERRPTLGVLRLERTLLVYRVDLDSLRRTLLVEEPREGRGQELVGLSVGHELLAVSHRSGELSVFRRPADGRAVRVLRKHYDRPVVPACLAEDTVLVAAGDAPLLLPVPVSP